MKDISSDKKRAPNRVENVFVIQILGQEHETWKGRVLWADTGKTRYFRSTLELFKLVDGALNDESALLTGDDEDKDEDREDSAPEEIDD